jgi:hypothetical protein
VLVQAATKAVECYCEKSDEKCPIWGYCTLSQKVQFGSRRSHEKVSGKTPSVKTKSSLNKLEVRSLKQANACRGTLTTHSDTYTIGPQGR